LPFVLSFECRELNVGCFPGSWRGIEGEGW
jgi:hypothetical protein